MPAATRRRVKTLRAALDWSHGLLSDGERKVFRRLGMFSGGCTVESAQQMTADAVTDESTVLDHLGALVEKSLVVADGGHRLRLLESARAYALEEIDRAGETGVLARRHAEHYAARFERQADALYAGTLANDMFIALRAAEIGNLRAAIDSSLQPQGDAQTALRLLVHAAPMAGLLSLHVEAARWWQTLAQRIDAHMTPRRAALCRYGWTHWGQTPWWVPGDWSDWLRIANAPLDAMADQRRQAHALWVHALQDSRVGRLAAAQAALDEAGRLEAVDWPAWLRIRRLFIQARVDRESAGSSASASAALAEALAELESAGEADGCFAFVVRLDLAVDSLVRGHVGEAVRSLQALVDLGRNQRRLSVDIGPVPAFLAGAHRAGSVSGCSAARRRSRSSPATRSDVAKVRANPRTGGSPTGASRHGGAVGRCMRRPSGAHPYASVRAHATDAGAGSGACRIDPPGVAGPGLARRRCRARQ